MDLFITISNLSANNKNKEFKISQIPTLLSQWSTKIKSEKSKSSWLKSHHLICLQQKDKKNINSNPIENSNSTQQLKTPSINNSTAIPNSSTNRPIKNKSQIKI